MNESEVRRTEQLDEAALLDGLRRREKWACTEMLRRYAGQVYHVALRLIRDPDEAEDVLQETFINACQKVHAFEGRSRLGTWLYRIATNAALMRLRKQRASTVSLDDPMVTEGGETFPQLIEDWSHEPDALMLTDELRQVLEQAIDTLPDSLRAVFVLRDIQGLSTSETAEVLGISPTAVKVRLHRARLHLREQLTAYFSEA